MNEEKGHVKKLVNEILTKEWPIAVDELNAAKVFLLWIVCFHNSQMASVRLCSRWTKMGKNQEREKGKGEWNQSE